MAWRPYSMFTMSPLSIRLSSSFIYPATSLTWPLSGLLPTMPCFSSAGQSALTGESPPHVVNRPLWAGTMWQIYVKDMVIFMIQAGSFAGWCEAWCCGRLCGCLNAWPVVSHLKVYGHDVLTTIHLSSCSFFQPSNTIGSSHSCLNEPLKLNLYIPCHANHRCYTWSHLVFFTFCFLIYVFCFTFI